MSATMNSPNDTVADAAVENNQIGHAEPSASAATDSHDLPLASGGYESDTEPDLNSTAGSKQRANANGHGQEPQFDALIELCRLLPHQLLGLSYRLRNILLNRADFRIDGSRRRRISLDGVDICDVSRMTLRNVSRKLGREKSLSRSLVTVYARHKEINRDIQIALETHSHVSETAVPLIAAQTIKPSHYEAHCALLRLRTRAAYINKISRRILHAVHLSDKEAYDYLKEFYKIQAGEYNALQ